MKLPQFSLRALFWFLFATAVALGWEAETYQLRWESRPVAICGNVGRPSYGLYSLHLRHTMTWLELDSDGALRAALDRSSRFAPQIGVDEIDWHLILSELMKRDRQEDLKQLCENWSQDGIYHPLPLTALYRSTNRHDPIEIGVGVSPPQSDAQRTLPPMVEAKVTNIDLGKRYLDVSGSQVLANWDAILVRDDGVTVARSDDYPARRLIPPVTRVLGPGEECSVSLDLRRYISAPASGTYRLQVLLSTVSPPAGEEVSEIIVWKSDPIRVCIVDHEHENRGLSIRAGIGIVVLAAGAVVVSRKLQKASGKWGQDLLALAIVCGLVAGWLYDVRQLRPKLPRPPDFKAHWTIEELPSA